MKTASGIVCVLVMLAGPTLSAQDKKDDAAAPGPVHRQLAKRAGDYATESKMWFQPGAEPMQSKGAATIRSILDGRFLTEQSSGTMAGKPYTSFHLEGYSNATKKYESSWTYTGSTAIMSLVGTSSDEGKTINYKATFTDDKGTQQTMFVETRHMDDDHFSVELYTKTPDGAKGVRLETTYTRKK